ncbi:MAG: PDZ domain-containing protein [Bacteroidia bacterium]|nr:PDZ domain-containing protein [Bacteroidia bacterium]
MKWIALLQRWLLWSAYGLDLVMAAPVRYRLTWDTPPRYTYHVEVEASPSKGKHTDFSLPAWRPGRYILQNYAGAVSHFSAYDGEGKPLPWRKVTKDTWRVQNPSRGSIRVQYRFYAKQIDAGSSYLSEGLVYLNPVNLLVYIPGRLEEPCELEIVSLPDGWDVATALPRQSHRRFSARDYHQLVDCPVLAAPHLLSYTTSCEELTLHVHFWGRVGAKSLAPFVEDLCKIIRVQKAIWGNKLPLSEYHFMYLLVPFQLRHAVEHETSAMFVLPEEGAASEEALKSFLGISAHEFFHVWNVKRLRPAALWPYRYDKECYTSLHWLTEGVTDYYTTLTLLRAGILSPEEYWKRLSTELSQIENGFAYQLFSPAELSVDSWLANSSYRPSHFQGSFYAAGKRVGFLLDMVLRRETKGKVTLDSLLRYLYSQYYEKGKGIPEDGVEKAAVRLGGAALRSFFARYVWGKESPIYEELLDGLPLRVHRERHILREWGCIGLSRVRSEGEGLRVEEILPGSLAERAGIEIGDILLTVGEQSVRDLPPDYWEKTLLGARLLLGWSREGFPMEKEILLTPEAASYRVEVHLTPTEPGFLLDF